MDRYFKRALPHPSPRAVITAGLGAFLAIAALSLLTTHANLLLLIAPFGASCVLLFSVPASPLSQPANVIGGHLLATAISLGLNAVLPEAWWALALAVGLSIAVMAALRLTHPPAGANPLVVFATDPGLSFLLFPVLTGAVALVVIAAVFHRLAGHEYPLKHD
ncbi:HPP family protein [Leisingera sp. M523]|uniref:HPP family protein n=1 Tax=Leisingera sp. M523 TaxID=2867013 RepID=UPI0021A6F89B|nr:HPP family protein [Leisingera sp. M523]UWQ30020.1 HPP family protein [Leisingera sp. M523]